MKSPEQRRAYRLANREKVGATIRAWKATNSERVRASARKRYAETREARREYALKWKNANRDKINAQCRARYVVNREKILKREADKRRLTMKEIVVENHLRDVVIARGGMCPKFVDPGRKGAPDRLVLLPGHPTYYVELKRPRGGVVEDHQKRYHDAIRAAGQQVWVLLTIPAVDEWMSSLA